jgi:glycosyltransferase involved in cell wall biosynthesis
MKKILILRDFVEDKRISMEIYADTLYDLLRSDYSQTYDIEEFTPKTPKWLQGVHGMRFSRYVLYPFQIIGKKADIFHIIEPGYAHLVLFLNPRKTVVSVHGLLPILLWKKRIPEITSSHIPLLTAFTFAVLKKVKYIISVSQNVKDDLVSILGFDPDRITVIPNGLGTQFINQMEIKQQRSVELSPLLNPDAIKILVSATKFYKNPETVIRTALYIKKHNFLNFQLIKTGFADKNWNQMLKQNGLDVNAVNLNYVAWEDMPDLYKNVNILFFPSLYEGFGWPPLEAMACGTPVVASNAASLPEVIGDAAAMFDPMDYEGFAGEIMKLSTDAVYRKMRIEKGLLQAKKFDWNESVRQIVEVYEKILTENQAHK